MPIQEHYKIFCGCGCMATDDTNRLLQCDCPRCIRRPVVIRDSCSYCSTLAAQNRAALAVIADPSLRELMQAEDGTEETERLPVAVPTDLSLPTPENLCTDPTPASGPSWPVPAATRRRSLL